MSQEESIKKPSKTVRKAQKRKNIRGFSRFLFAINLMLDAAAKQSEHDLTRNETLLLSIFRNANEHPYPLDQVDKEFRRILVVRPDNKAATADLKEAVAGLVRKGLLNRVSDKTAVELTPTGRSELERISEAMDAVWDRLTVELSDADRVSLRTLISKITPSSS